MKKATFRKILFLGLLSLILANLILPSNVWATDLKKIVAVSRFENRTSLSGQVNLDNGMADQLTDALIQSGNFIVLERQTLSDVMEEQDLADSGRAQKSKSARTGKVTSAQILIKGTITEFERNGKGSGSGGSFMGVRIRTKKDEAHIGLTIRLIDTTTGQVLDSNRVEGRAESGGFKFGLDFGGSDFGTEAFKKTPLGKATQIAIDNAVGFIAAKLKAIPFKGRIIKIKEDDIYLTAGKQNGASIGDVFNVYTVDEELVDPDTGELLGAEETKIGTVKIFQIEEKFSKAKILNGKDFNMGDVIRREL